MNRSNQNRLPHCVRYTFKNVHRKQQKILHVGIDRRPSRPKEAKRSLRRSIERRVFRGRVPISGNGRPTFSRASGRPRRRSAGGLEVNEHVHSDTDANACIISTSTYFTHHAVCAKTEPTSYYTRLSPVRVRVA